MTTYKPPRWHYEYGKTGKGYNLKLLSIDEVFISADLLKEWIKPTNAIDKPELYKPMVRTKEYESLWLYCNRLINNIKKLQPNEVTEHDMDSLNTAINRIFSDIGWREMKKKFRQQDKRQRKVRVVLSTSVANALNQFKEQQGLATIDESVDELLSFHSYHNEHSEVIDEQ